MEDIVKCKRICVDCVSNDPVDIRCGGPSFLGFDFNVLEEEAEQLKAYIIELLKELEIPFQYVYIDGEVFVKSSEIWNREKIAASINDDADYLIDEYRSRNRLSFRF